MSNVTANNKTADKPKRGSLPPRDKFESIFNALCKQLINISAILLLFVTIPICLDVLLRFFKISALDGIVEAELMMIVTLGFLSMAYPIIIRQPMQINIFYEYFNTKLQKRVDLVGQIACACIAIVVSFEAYQTAMKWHIYTAVLDLPEWIFVLITSIGLLLVCVALLFQVRHLIYSMLADGDKIGIVIGLACVVLFLSSPFLYRMSGLQLSGLALGTIGFSLLLAMLFFKFQIGLAMALAGLMGLITIMRTPELAFSMLGDLPFRNTADFIFITFPMFMLMGEVMYHSGLSDDLFDFAKKWMGRMPGGLALASVGGCAGFGAVCGESIATVMTMSSVALPPMREAGYDAALATGTLAAGGTLGILIPPSMGFIFYAVVTEESIGKLFVAGIIPGILLCLIFMGIIVAMVLAKPSLAPKTQKYTFKEKVLSSFNVLPVVGIFVIVVGGILTGLFTPGEGGAVGAFCGIVYAFARKRMSWKELQECIYATALMLGKIFILFAGLYCFGAFLTMSRLPYMLADFVVALEVNKYMILLAVIVLYIFLGCIMNIMLMMLLTLPSIYPTIMALGFDSVWFGVILVIVMEMGMITPPVGMNVITLSSLTEDVPMSTVYRGVMPFFVGMLFCVFLLVLFPGIVTYLPTVLF